MESLLFLVAGVAQQILDERRNEENEDDPDGDLHVDVVPRCGV
jgi:hypothetical protein